MVSKNIKMAWYLSLNPEMSSFVKKSFRGFPLTLKSVLLDKNNIEQDAEILCVFVDSKVDLAVIKAMPKLKLIVTMSMGFDHIDLRAAKKRKISVCNIPSYGENTVAEHALALLLTLSRKIFDSVKRVKEGIYDYHGLRGFDLKGKTVGVFGTGKIGCHLIEMLHGFGVNIIAFDAFPKKELQEKLGFKYVAVKELLAESDIISLHLPLLPETEHFLNKRRISQMKKGAVIINTARGGLIDSKALLAALQSGHIAGAGLDVLEDEEYLQHPEMVFGTCPAKDKKLCLMNNMIIDHPHTVVTPHNAFNSVEAVQRIFNATIETINIFLQKKELKNKV